MEEGSNKVVCKPEGRAHENGRDLLRRRQNSIRNEGVDYFSLIMVVLVPSATDSAFLADFGLLDAVFRFHAARERQRTDLRHDFLVRRQVVVIVQ